MSLEIKTYSQLKVALSQMDNSQLGCDLTVYNAENDEYFPARFVLRPVSYKIDASFLFIFVDKTGNVRNKTFLQLKEEVDQMDDNQLGCRIMVVDEPEMYDGRLEITRKDDVLDEGHPFIAFGKEKE